MDSEEEQRLHQQLIYEECEAVKLLLMEKNADYGSSFAHPIGIFARGLSAEQQIAVRIDDKSQRILTGRNEISEDTELDLIGYLVLKRVLRRITVIATPDTTEIPLHMQGPIIMRVIPPAEGGAQ